LISKSLNTIILLTIYNFIIMKKIAIFLSIVVAAIACDKVDPVTPPEVDFSNPDVVIPFQGSEEEPVVLSFKVNVDWTAELDQAYDWLSIAPTSGKAGEAAIEIYASENESEEVRAAVVKVKAGVSVLSFDVVQNGVPYLNTSDTNIMLDAAAGNYEFTIQANLAYKLNVPAAEWLTVTEGENGKVTLTYTQNEALGSRSTEITLVPDLSGEGLGKTISVVQNGRAVQKWTKFYASDLSDIAAGAPLRLAVAGDKLYVSNGAGVHALNRTTGEYLAAVPLPEGFTVHSLVNDHAGNILVAGVAAAGADLDIYYLTALDAAPVKLMSFNNNVADSNMGNVRVYGDVTKKAVITTFASVYNYASAHQILNGALTETKQLAMVAGDPSNPWIWDVNNGCVQALGDDLADGIVANGYTSPYDVQYTNDYTSWTVLYDEAAAGNENFPCFSALPVGDKNYLAYVRGAHFNYGLAPDVVLLDVTTPSEAYEIYTLSSSSYLKADQFLGTGATSDVVLAPSADGSIWVYATDGNYGVITGIEIK
jgi:hypothetical protein